MKTIYLAGGCFWGVEGYFAQLEGIIDTTVGYANGRTEVTSYELIGATDHAETIELTYDPKVISLDTILQHYFRIIDPFSVNQQGNDRGRQYRTGIFYRDEADATLAQGYLDSISHSYGKEPAVILEPLTHFIDAEDYHQDYLAKNPNGYCHIDLNLAKVPLT
ncbi:peptide-methionine (S)-S-oxide reductase MsrA [Streptococcus ovuberis]|uniref:Peptide methionine sulfoxide reductase MsrA n=1 Tax=Streptococcus ovuberis TaxID=1936207 RepID=A0A7X6S150_9STRE|nr:peptide-methionine (S)-S-oxide reductase MsrA [Streptococcus ovuberis]NKZ20809.1 peptide-methionine (S)-S-oxide reductase MsrA [Streptococcus ovuberis]